MTRQGRAFLVGGGVLILAETLLVFALQPAEWLSIDLVGVYTTGDVPFATVAFGLVALFAASTLLVSAARRIGNETHDFHRRHRHPTLSQWSIYTGMAATASGIILSFGFCNFFTLAGYLAYDLVPSAPALGGGLETMLANITVGLVLLGLSAASAVGWLVTRAMAQRRPVTARTS